MMTAPDRLQPRKQPRQSRSKHTVDAILSATARVLVAEGYEHASTNRIAEVAGVSVGSLYQYFPNKQSLVIALIEQHCEQMLATLASHTKSAPPTLQGGVEAYVEGMFAAYARNPALYSVLVRQAQEFGDVTLRQFEQRGTDVAREVLSARRSEIRVADFDLAVSMVVTTVRAVINRALSAIAGSISHETYRNEVVVMVLGYLRRA